MTYGYRITLLAVALFLLGCQSTPPARQASTPGYTIYRPPAVPFFSWPRGLDKYLLERYVAFSVDIPADWTILIRGEPPTQTAGASYQQYFLLAERRVRYGERDVVIESFSVRALLDDERAPKSDEHPPLLEELAHALKEPGKPVWEGEARVQDERAWEMHFEKDLSYSAERPVKEFTRVLVLPRESKLTNRSGLVITIVSSQYLPDVKSAADVGRVGDTNVMMRSLRFYPVGGLSEDEINLLKSAGGGPFLPPSGATHPPSLPPSEMRDAPATQDGKP